MLLFMTVWKPEGIAKKNKIHIIRILIEGTYAECFIVTTVNYYSLIIIMPFVLENTHH